MKFRSAQIHRPQDSVLFEEAICRGPLAHFPLRKPTRFSLTCDVRASRHLTLKKALGHALSTLATHPPVYETKFSLVLPSFWTESRWHERSYDGTALLAARIQCLPGPNTWQRKVK